MDYVFGVIVLALIYTIAATADNFAVGYTGQFSAAQGALFGVGAYTFTFTTNGGWPLYPAMLFTIVVGMCAGGLLSFIGNRVRGDNFMVVTLAFQLVLVDIAGNIDVTGGEQGLGGIRPVTLGAFIPGKPVEWTLVVLVFAAITGVIAWLLTRTRLSLIWKAVREDESATASLGRSPAWAKVSAFGVSAGGLALAGSLYGSYISYVSPSEFTVSFSVFIISAIIVGGMGNPLGPLVGIVILTALPEALRFVPGLPLDVKARVLQLLYAAFLLGFLALRPQGLLPEGVFRGRKRRSQAQSAPAAQRVPSEVSS